MDADTRKKVLFGAGAFGIALLAFRGRGNAQTAPSVGGLPTGVADPTPVPSAGSSTTTTRTPNATVLAAQIRLYRMGYMNDRADGIFGPITSAAVRAFQSDSFSLTPTGQLDADTLTQIANEFADRQSGTDGTVPLRAYPYPVPSGA